MSSIERAWLNQRWLTSLGGTVRTITYSYNAADELTAVTDPDATLSFSYDSGGRLVAVTSLLVTDYSA